MKKYYHYRINCCFHNNARKCDKWLVIDAPSKKIAIQMLKEATVYRNWNFAWHLTGCPKHYILWLERQQYHYDIHKLYQSLYFDNEPF